MVRSMLIGPTSRFSVTGISIAFDMLLDGFRQRGLPFVLIDLEGLGRAKNAGAFELRRAMKTLLLLLSVWLQLWRVQNVYILIASSRFGFLRDALMIWPSRWLGRRIVLHLNGGGYRDFYQQQKSWIQWLIRATLAQADAVVILGNLLRDQFDFVPKIDVKLQVVPNGLPLGLEPTVTTLKSLPKDGPLRLLYLSNMIESKGYLDVLAACRILHYERQVPIMCDFCGDFLSISVDENKLDPNDAKVNFLNLIETWGLNNVVKYRGVVKGKIKQAFLEEAHILVLPTVYPWEGQPISIIEALAFATPVISTPHRGIPEEITDGYNGFLVEGHAPEQIADAIKRLWSTSGLYSTMSSNAVRHFRAHFTQEQYINRLISIILK